MTQKARILIADDEDSVRRVLSIQLKRLGHETVEAENGAIAWKKLAEAEFQVLITDLKMPEMDGLELLAAARKTYPQIPVIMMTAHGTIDTAVEAMKRGAFDYITKPFNQDDFLKTIDRAILSHESMAKEFQRSRTFLRQEEKIIGSTDEMEKVYSVIERVANSSSPVLINGEAGTGKEVVVRLLHDKSGRRTSPLVRAYISATPQAQQEEQFFGQGDHPGWIRLADGGSLYLDEVGALSLDLQAKLHDAFSHQSFVREGNTYSVNCRIIASSDENLLEKIEAGTFRKDLFYFLNVVPVYLPPLRERTQDIEPLVDHFLKIFSKKFNKNVRQLDDEALFHLIQYPWPGNIRELENCLEYVVNISDKPVVTKDLLPSHLFSAPVSTQRQAWNVHRGDALRSKVEKLERGAIEEAMSSSHGDLLKAAQKLGVPPSLLEEKASLLKISTSR